MTNIPTLGPFKFRWIFLFLRNSLGWFCASVWQRVGRKIFWLWLQDDWTNFLSVMIRLLLPAFGSALFTSEDAHWFSDWSSYEWFCLSSLLSLNTILPLLSCDSCGCFVFLFFFYFDDSTRDLRPICKWFVAVALEPVYQSVSTRWSY